MNKFKGPIRFAVVGCGMLARMMHIPNIARSPHAVLQVCCDLDDAALATCRDKFGARRTTRDMADAINDPEVDAICLATTEKIRVKPIELAAAAGKPVYVEKPLAKSMAEMYRIRDIVRQANIPFCVGHNRRSAPAMIDAHRIFRAHMQSPQPCPWRYDREGDKRPGFAEDGVAGMCVRINDDWHSWKGWVFDAEQAPYGPMLFEMTHFTDMCNWFLAGRPREVVALEYKSFNSGCVIAYEGGEMATISMAANGTFGYGKERYEMMGQGAMVTVEHLLEVRTAGISNAPARTVYPMLNDQHPEVGTQLGYEGWLAKRAHACELAAKAGNPMLQFTAEPDKGHARAIERFIDEITGAGPVVCGVEDAVLATEVAFAAVLSARRRQAVTLDEVRAEATVKA
jgi:predicted dehydrogenase